VRFRFDADLPHQRGAIDAVCDLFRGAETNDTPFSLLRDRTAELPLAGATLAIGNPHPPEAAAMLTNLHEVQARGGLARDDALHSMDFTVEMETGTGKTYVYLRTIFELNRRFGFTRFVIVVPSVAIREGVRKSIAQTRAHFHDLYDGVPFDAFVYDSARLDRIRDFATAGGIRVMIATIQSLGTRSAVFQQPREQTHDLPAVQWVAETRPIVLIDEPQSVDANPDGAGARILRAMHPVARLRYSATHVRQFHRVYRLDAFDAHDRWLVKSIEVDGATVHDADNLPFVRLLTVEPRPGARPRARIELAVQRATETVREPRWVEHGDDLQTISGRAIHADMRIGAIDTRDGGSMELACPGHVTTLRPGQAHGDVDPDGMARAMIARTIRHHLDKELRNRPMGIKTLSLFFVDRVADYRVHAPDGTATPGRLATMFEAEYARIAALPAYYTLFVDTPIDPVGVHGGYFSADNRGRLVEYERTRTGELNAAAARLRDATFDLILRDKERLLDEREPLRFLFSHSALREGWDNPNVFQICMLRAMGGERQRRQSIGRGLRLAVDRDGIRRQDEGLNRLTIISDEPFRAFASGLQAEVEQALGIRLGFVDPDLFAAVRFLTAQGEEDVIGTDAAHMIHTALTAAGMIADGRATDRLRAALAAGTVPLPADLPPAAAAAVRERLTRLTRTLPVADAHRTGRIDRNPDIWDGHDFRHLWSQIAWKTTYRLAFDDAELIDACARSIAAMPAPGAARVVFETATIGMGREGVFVRRTATAAPRALDTGTLPIPDLLAQLQERTTLPRAVLARILVASGRLEDARINPAAFLDGCTVQINVARRGVLVGGIAYTRLDERWAQTLFQPQDDIDLARIVRVRHAPMDGIVTDSAIERDFATDLDQSEPIRVFAKLPRGFRIATPLGTYNPDWAIARDRDDGTRVCLVVETKGDRNALRSAEIDQIRCGIAHFAALDIRFATATTLNGVLATDP